MGYQPNPEVLDHIHALIGERLAGGEPAEFAAKIAAIIKAAPQWLACMKLLLGTSRRVARALRRR